jgi:DNA replication protein DnaC
LNQVTLNKMQALRLTGMLTALEQQRRGTEHAKLSFEDRFGLLVDAEWEARENRKLTNRLRQARLRYPASLEDVDFHPRRGLDRRVVLALGSCQWIRERQNLVVTGATGTGKSYLACAFVERACRSGHSAAYVRTVRLLHELAVARGDGSYRRLLAKLAKLDLLALDDWLLAPLSDSERRDLVEVLEDRSEQRSTLVATQHPVKSWHEAIGEESMADAICDRLVHGAHRLALKGPSMREVRAASRGEKAAPKEVTS